MIKSPIMVLFSYASNSKYYLNILQKMFDPIP